MELPKRIECEEPRNPEYDILSCKQSEKMEVDAAGPTTVSQM